MPKTVLRIEASCITRCATPEKLLELLPVWRPPRDCFARRFSIWTRRNAMRSSMRSMRDSRPTNGSSCVRSIASSLAMADCSSLEPAFVNEPGRLLSFLEEVSRMAPNTLAKDERERLRLRGRGGMAGGSLAMPYNQPLGVSGLTGAGLKTNYEKGEVTRDHDRPRVSLALSCGAAPTAGGTRTMKNSDLKVETVGCTMYRRYEHA